MPLSFPHTDGVKFFCSTVEKTQQLIISIKVNNHKCRVHSSHTYTMNIGRKKLSKRKSDSMKHFQYASPIGGSPISVNDMSFSCSPTHKESLSQSTKPDRRPLERLDKSVSFADDVEFVSKWKERVKKDEWETIQDSCALSACKMSLSACEEFLIGDDVSHKNVYYQFDADVTDHIRGDTASKTDLFTPQSSRESQDDSLDISPSSWSKALQSSTSTSLSNSESYVQSQEIHIDSNGFPDSREKHENVGFQQEENTLNTTSEISQCVADILEQTMASKVDDCENSSLNEKNSQMSMSMTTTNEIEECVADILEQTMAPNVDDCDNTSLNEKQSQMSMTTTNEIEECVADILEQTMASDRLLTRLCYSNSSEHATKSKYDANKSMHSDAILSEAAVVDDIITTGQSSCILAPKTIAFKTKENKKSKSLLPHQTFAITQGKETKRTRVKSEKWIESKNQNSVINLELEDKALSQGYVSSDSDTRSSQTVPSIKSSSVSSSSVQQPNVLLNDDTISFNSNIVPLDIYEEIQFLNAEASLYLTENDFDSAITAFDKLLAFYASSIGENHPAVSSTYHNIGIAHSKRASMSEYEKEVEEYNMLSLQAFRKAVSIAEVTMGENHPSVAVSLVRIGLILLQMGDFEESNSTFHKCLNIRKASLGKYHPLVAKVYNNIGVAELHADRMEKALSAFDSACSIQRKVLGQMKDSSENNSIAEMELADTLSNICTLCLDLAEKDASIEVNSNLAKKAHLAIIEAIQIREKHCNHRDERILQAKGLLNDAETLMDRHLNEEEQEYYLPDESSNSSSYVTAVCDAVVSCPSDENLLSSPSALDKNIAGSDDSLSRVMDWSPFQIDDASQEKGFEVAPLDVSFKTVNSIPAANSYSHDFINSVKPNLEQINASRISGDVTNSTSPSKIKYESQECRSNHSISSNLEPKAVEFQIFDSPIRQQVGDENKSDLRVSFSQVQDQNSFLMTSDDAFGCISSSPVHDSKSSKWFDEVELAKFPNKYPTQIHELASTCLENGEFELSLSWFQILLEQYKAKHGELHQNIGATLHNIGIVQMRLENYDEALLSFQKAVRVRRGAIGRDHADVATSLVKVGVVELLLHRFDAALLTFREALSVRRHALGHLHPSTARIYNNIGCAHAKFNEVREARCAFEAALDVQRNALLYDPGNEQLQFAVSTTLSNLAHLYTSRGMHAKASMVLAEALSFQESVFCNDHPLVMSTLDALADSYASCGENINALKCYSDILERIEKKGDKNGKRSNRKRRAVAMLLYKTSRVHRKQNDLEASLRFLKDSLQHADQLAMPDLSSRIMNEIEEIQQQLQEVNFDWV